MYNYTKLTPAGFFLSCNKISNKDTDTRLDLRILTDFLTNKFKVKEFIS